MNEKINELIAEKERLEKIVHATKIGTWEWEVQTGKVIFNEIWANIIGYSLEELAPTSIKTWEKHSHPEDLKKSGELLERVFNKELDYYEFEARMKHKNGKWIWVLDKGEVVKWNENGQPIKMVGSHTEITEIKNITSQLNALVEELGKTKFLFETSLNCAVDFYIFSVDNNYEYYYFNLAHKKFMKNLYDVDIEVGMNILDLITDKHDKNQCSNNIDSTLKGESHDLVCEFSKFPNRYFGCFFTPMSDKNDNIIGCTCMLREITEKVEDTRTIRDNEEKLRVILDSTAEGIYGVDLDEMCTFINQKGYELLGYKSTEEIIGKNIHNLIHHTKKDGSKYPIEECSMRISFDQNKSSRSNDDVLWRKDGTSIPVNYTSIPEYKDGKIDGAVVTFRDISESKRSSEILKYERNIAQMYLDVMATMILALDVDGNITMLNKKGCEILEYKEEEVLGKNWFDNFIPKTNLNEIKQVFKNVFKNKTQLAEHYENVIVTKNNKEKVISWYNSILYNIKGEIIGVLSSGEDITESKEYEESLKRLGYHDALTGLYNRRYYEEILDEIDVEENYPLTVIMGDINGLKLINDAFGHSAGDELLISAANVITRSCKDTDMIARIGGDEFVILLPNTDEIQSDKIIEKIHNKISQIKIESIQLSISFGSKTKYRKNEDLREIYRSAEDLMYREKLLEIPSMRSGAIETILNTLYEKDKNSEIHSRSVSILSESIAKEYGLSRQDVAEVKTAGLLHDIGKIIISLDIINKDGKLTSSEYSTMKTHPEIGFRILNSTQDMRGISNIVLCHHERWDGLGYPRGIKEEEIPFKSRIISIADSYDAMTSERTYKEVISKEDALKEIIDNSGTQFDPKLVKVFEENFEEIIKVLK